MKQKKLTEFLGKNIQDESSYEKKSNTDITGFGKKNSKFDKIPEEKIIKIRSEVKKGKTKERIAKELGVGVTTVYRYATSFRGEIKRSKETIKKIRQEVRRSRSKKETAEKLGLTYSTVRYYTRDINTTQPPNLSDKKIRKIRQDVLKGKTKIQVSREQNVSYKTVKRHTSDILSTNRIPDELIQLMQKMARQGMLKKDIAKELGVCNKTVQRYTKQFQTCKKTPAETIKKIRDEVRRCSSKIEVARKLNISHDTVNYYTKDIILRKKIPLRKIKKIRSKVLNEESKSQVAKDLKISYDAVLHYTKDIPSPIFKKYGQGHPGLRGKTLLILQEIIRNGYYINKPGDNNRYQIIRKYFSNICMARVYNKTVLFLEDRSDDAVRGFLEHINKRKLGEHELEAISKVFRSKLSKKRKTKI